MTRLSLGVENFDDRDPRDQRPRAPLAGDRHAPTRFARVARLPADQHRSDRRHARRDGRELAALRREDASRSSPTASPSTRWSCPSTRRSARTSCRRPRQLDRHASPAGTTKRRWVQEAFDALERAGYHDRQRLHRGEGSGEDARSSIAIASGRAPTWPASASPRSATSTASTCRTRTRGKPTARRSTAASCRSRRAYRPTPTSGMLRELVLQLKLGRLDPAYFAAKYGVDILGDFARAVRVAARRGLPDAGRRRRRRALARRACSASTRCCRASSCRSTSNIRYT